MAIPNSTKLPRSVQEIADVIGREQALRLIGSLPPSGSRSWRVCLYVPKTLTSPDHRLVKVLGWGDAQKLVEEFAGMILQPSNCRQIARRIRNARIQEMKYQGVTLVEIASTFDLSTDRVREIASLARNRSVP